MIANRGVRLYQPHRIVTVLLIVFAVAAGASLPAAHAQVGSLAAGSSFNSGFNGNHAGWSLVTGPWKQLSTSYMSPGLADGWTSIQHSGSYGNFSYRVRMKRTSSINTASQCIMARGDASSLWPNKFWTNSYYFCYGLAGTVNIGKVVSGVQTSYYSMNPGGFDPTGWVVVKIVMYQDDLFFWLNDALLLQVSSDTSFSTGRVGIAVTRPSGSSNNKLKVDWARLTVIP